MGSKATGDHVPQALRGGGTGFTPPRPPGGRWVRDRRLCGVGVGPRPAGAVEVPSSVRGGGVCCVRPLLPLPLRHPYPRPPPGALTLTRVPVAMMAPSWPDGSNTSRDSSVRITSPGALGGIGLGGV